MDATQGRLGSIRRRRVLSLTVTLMAVGATASAMQTIVNRMGDASTFTGWTLLAATAGLYLLSLRKKLPQYRLGPVSAWLQMHTYMGSFASVIFLMHIGWPIRGWFESTLAACFAFVAGSGIVLAFLNRTTPKRLAAIKQDYRLEQIPQLQLALAQNAHQVAVSSVAVGEGATLAEFYQRRLLPYLHNPRNWLYSLLPNGFARRQLLRELNDLDRYLADNGRLNRESMVAIIQSKDDLDYHYALQYRLRLVFLMHVALTWSLALMIAVHVVLVYRFQGTLL
jgi:hypothetical protein